MASEVEPDMNCPVGMAEIWIYIFLGVGIIVLNVIFLIVKINFKPQYHRENKYYMINLSVTNMFCGITWVLVALARIYPLPFLNHTCKILVFIRTYFTYLPFVCLVAMGLDVVYYCHYALEYSVRMSKRKVFGNIILCWLYTLIVGIVSFSVQSADFCVLVVASTPRLKFIAYPIMCMLLPGISVLVAVAFIIFKYQIKNVKRHNATSVTFRGQFHLSRFLIKFFHLIIACVIFGFIHTATLIAHYALEKGGDRSCWIYYLNYAVVFPTCLLSPLFYCLIKKEVRRRIFKNIIGCSCRKQNDIRISVKEEDTRFSSCCAKFHPKLSFGSLMRHHKIGILPRSPLHSTLQPELNFPSVISDSFNSIVVMLHNGGNIKEAIRNGISTSVPPGVLMAPPVVATISESVVPRQINVIPDIVLLYKPTAKSEDDYN